MAVLVDVIIEQIPPSPQVAGLAMSSEFWSAICGAIVGGVIALVIQLIALGESRKLRIEEATERRRTLGQALLIKLSGLYSHLRLFERQVDEWFLRAPEFGTSAEPWQFATPILNLPDKISFSTDELSMLLALKNDALFNSMLSMDSVHNSILALFAALKEKHELLADQLPSTFEGRIASTQASPEQLSRARPTMININIIASSLRATIKRDADEAHQALHDLNSALRENLGLKYILAPVEDDPASPQS
jgi:hypothetical protein